MTEKNQPVMKFLPNKEILNFGEFCPFTCRNLDMSKSDMFEVGWMEVRRSLKHLQLEGEGG